MRKFSLTIHMLLCVATQFFSHFMQAAKEREQSREEGAFNELLFPPLVCVCVCQGRWEVGSCMCYSNIMRLSLKVVGVEGKSSLSLDQQITNEQPTKRSNT
jgi:hypothetical protein